MQLPCVGVRPAVCSSGAVGIESRRCTRLFVFLVPGQPGGAARRRPLRRPACVGPDAQTSPALGARKDGAAGLGHTPAIDRNNAPHGLTGEGSYDAPVASAGYGTVNKEHTYDDYSGIDLGGRVVLAMRYEPH